jgi:ATP-dependent RNA/DNA helicase IGHMBP2
MHPHIQHLLQCIQLEEKEQAERFQLNETHSLKALKAEGLALHPISITRKTFGYLDYPEIGFRLPYPVETSLFKDGAAIECFCAGEEPIKGILLQWEGRSGEFRLHAPDYPEWLENDGVGIKLAPDTRTTTIMTTVLKALPERKAAYALFEQWQDGKGMPTNEIAEENLQFFNSNLNASQQAAVRGIVANQACCVVHGPPGTGKTTTLVEAIRQLVLRGEKVLVTAPSNTAVDHISLALIQMGIQLLRVGNTGKVSEAVFAHTPEGKMSAGKTLKEIKKLRIRADEFRRMAMTYKRQFGKAEREQRKQLMLEVKSIRQQIRQLQQYEQEQLFAQAQVIAGTPIGIYDAGVHQLDFGTLVMDEAGQCIEPLFWCVAPLANKWVLAGDHWQLPPTVLSNLAVQKGFNRSPLEVAVAKVSPVFLLNVQYRMPSGIAGFSSAYFYGGALSTAPALQSTDKRVVFVDTAGTGFAEEHGKDGVSLQNPGELNIVAQLLAAHALPLNKTAIISPYSGQVSLAKENLPAGLRISTIDSFQGQEMDVVVLSLVRSNDAGDIGFLKDYRRMNVAITRAKQMLFVVGDSATIGADAFYKAFLEYVELHGQYQTAWEFDLGW